MGSFCIACFVDCFDRSGNETFWPRKRLEKAAAGDAADGFVLSVVGVAVAKEVSGFKTRSVTLADSSLGYNSDLPVRNREPSCR